jgi:hypothetical protein
MGHAQTPMSPGTVQQPPIHITVSQAATCENFQDVISTIKAKDPTGRVNQQKALGQIFADLARQKFRNNEEAQNARVIAVQGHALRAFSYGRELHSLVDKFRVDKSQCPGSYLQLEEIKYLAGQIKIGAWATNCLLADTNTSQGLAACISFVRKSHEQWLQGQIGLTAPNIYR